MKFNFFFFLPIFTLLTSCNGQPGTHTTSEVKAQHRAAGETVSEPDSCIWSIFQDKDDHYWFGSNGKGVYRYDGKTLLRFSTTDGLLNDSIRGIQQDKAGNIFITSMGGISKFDGQQFTTLHATASNEWKLNPDDLWFSILGKAGEQGVYRYDGKTLHDLKFPKHHMEDSFFAANGKHPWSPYEVYCIYKDRKGTMWFGTSSFGVCRYDGKSLSWLYEEHLTMVKGGGSFGIRSILEDKQGKFWFCNTSYRYNILPASGRHNSTLIDYTHEKGIDNLAAPDGNKLIYFPSAVEDDNGDLWMVNYNQGVWRYNGKKVTHYPLQDGDNHVKLFSIYKDRKGTLWLGSLDAGAYRFNGKTFEQFKP
ncbi:MAG: two-component regulator propeller domain-containing protein [Bacteroidota bacterium]